MVESFGWKNGVTLMGFWEEGLFGRREAGAFRDERMAGVVCADDRSRG